MADGTIITDSQGDESLTKRRKNFMKRVHLGAVCNGFSQNGFTSKAEAGETKKMVSSGF
jgi:hypothetical protein